MSSSTSGATPAKQPLQQPASSITPLSASTAAQLRSPPAASRFATGGLRRALDEAEEQQAEVADPEVMIAELEALRQTMQEEIGERLEYAEPMAGVVVNKTYKKIGRISDVLYVFLGPPSSLNDIPNRPKGWNPFTRDGSHEANYVKSLQGFHNKFEKDESWSKYREAADLGEHVLVDAFPHKNWLPTKQTTNLTQEDLIIGARWLRKVILLLRPSIVVCFGQSAGWVVRRLHEESRETIASIPKQKTNDVPFSMNNLTRRIKVLPFPKDADTVDQHELTAIFLRHPSYLGRDQNQGNMTGLMYAEAFRVLAMPRILFEDEVISAGESDDDDDDDDEQPRAVKQAAKMANENKQAASSAAAAGAAASAAGKADG